MNISSTPAVQSATSAAAAFALASTGSVGTRVNTFA